MTTTTMNSGC
uniref:Uncharacterized protein n=1 Tax=Macrostomum lignano TaxID=282301 RepID=A0A1I8JQR5_9PLAT